MNTVALFGHDSIPSDCFVVTLQKVLRICLQVNTANDSREKPTVILLMKQNLTTQKSEIVLHRITFRLPPYS